MAGLASVIELHSCLPFRTTKRTLRTQVLGLPSWTPQSRTSSTSSATRLHHPHSRRWRLHRRCHRDRAILVVRAHHVRRCMRIVNPARQRRARDNPRLPAEKLTAEYLLKEGRPATLTCPVRCCTLSAHPTTGHRPLDRARRPAKLLQAEEPPLARTLATHASPVH